MDKVRAFEEADYAAICEWWEARGWPQLPLDLLPQIGGIVDDKAVGFLYRTDSAVGWMEWIVASPGNGAAVPAIVDYLIEKAAEVGCKIVLTTTNNDKLKSWYKEAGFEVTDTTMTNMVRRI